MKNLALFLVVSFGLAANPMIDFSKDQKIAVQNTILSKVNGKTISMMDVKKKMDMVFHQHYSHLAHSNQARLQYYEVSWRRTLMDMIDNELIIADALDKEIKLTDADVREVMEERFGPNVLQTLDKIGLSYDETWKMVKDELIVQRMSWWFIHSKAMSSVTPQDIRQAYRRYIKENPAYSEWKYRVISIKTDQPTDTLAHKVHQLLLESDQEPSSLESALKSLETAGASITLSNEYVAKTAELSDLHKACLAPLTPGCYSQPSFQMSRDKKNVYRIFYLIAKNEHPVPAFEDLAIQLKNDLVQKAAVAESQHYFTKLRKHYGFDSPNALPEDLHPFSLQ
jgi:hypothetical protein